VPFAASRTKHNGKASLARKNHKDACLVRKFDRETLMIKLRQLEIILRHVGPCHESN
jgi:hypothetical protein